MFSQQIHRTLGQLLRPQLFGRGVDGIAHPVDNVAAALQLFLLAIIQRSPLNFAAAFRPSVALPECPATVDVPALACQLDVLDAHAVDFTRRALDQAQIVCAGKVQRNAVAVNAISCFLAPARIGGLSRQGNFHGFGCHYSVLMIKPAM